MISFMFRCFGKHLATTFLSSPFNLLDDHDTCACDGMLTAILEITSVDPWWLDLYKNADHLRVIFSAYPMKSRHVIRLTRDFSSTAVNFWGYPIPAPQVSCFTNVPSRPTARRATHHPRRKRRGEPVAPVDVMEKFWCGFITMSCLPTTSHHQFFVV